jgi:hypothetical protein
MGVEAEKRKADVKYIDSIKSVNNGKSLRFPLNTLLPLLDFIKIALNNSFSIVFSAINLLFLVLNLSPYFSAPTLIFHTTKAEY